MKKLKYILIGLLGILTLPVAFGQTSYEYYYGDGCGYCANVAEFMENYDLENQVDIKKYEVWYDEDNKKRFKKTTDQLGIGSQGVPFLLIKKENEKDYLVGDSPIISHFKENYDLKKVKTKKMDKNTKIYIFLGGLVFVIVVSIIGVSLLNE